MPETRRGFFKTLGGGILVLLVEESVDAQETGARQRGSGGAMPQEISAWLHIGAEGRVTVYTGKTEVGQDIRTSLAQAVAEELHTPLGTIHLVMGDTDLTPYDMGTFGSRSTPFMAPQLRKAAAAAREILIGLAAERWGAERSTLAAAEGRIRRSGSDQTLAYAELAKGQKLTQTIPAETALTPAAQWKVSGVSIPKVNGRDFVTGRHKYVSDMKLPGMLHGKVVRAPAWNATLAEVDLKPAQALPGVTALHEGDFVGVAAATPEEAAEAARLVRAQWNTSPQPSSRGIFTYLKSKATEGRSEGGTRRGSMEAGMAAAAQKLKQTYMLQYIAHAPLEPRAALAEWKDGKLTVWTGTQRPFGVRSELSSALGVPEDRVRVIVPDTGSGYGGKHSGDAAVEAARLAKAAGRPVKLVWTREEEFLWAYFRPAGVIEVSSGISADGRLTAWEFHNYNSGGAGIQTLYDVPNQLIQYHPVQSPLRQGSYRALAAPANFFARETHMDELALAARLDPLEFRLRNLTDPRLRAVFEAAAARFGWNNRKKPAPHHGYGLAGGFEKGSYVANCVEVSVSPQSGAVAIRKVVVAFECGAVVNPDHLKNQVQGMIMMGIGGALFEAVEFENGRMLNPRFSRYRVPRFSDVPPIDVVLLDRKDLPSAGGGETPICALAPALGSAIFDATGIRLRSLPLAPRGVRAGA